MIVKRHETVFGDMTTINWNEFLLLIQYNYGKKYREDIEKRLESYINNTYHGIEELK